VDVTAISARLTFECASRTAYAQATMRFRAEGGPLYFDLRQRIESATLDGEPLDPERLSPRHEGLRAIDVSLDVGEHELTLSYPLTTPACTDAVPLGWALQRPGILFDLWMSDLHPGRYLEMWLPAPLCHDQFALDIDVQVEGAGPHRIFANGAIDGTTVRYPGTFTSLSPMLVVVPEERYDLLSTVEDGVTVETFKLAGPEIDLAACHVTVTECLAHNRARFGPYGHGDRFLTYVWGSTRGMEYDGATTASVGSLEHEVFHSWFGRGVKPADASDGWIDEAFTTWYTAGPPRRSRWAESFDWNEPLVRLRPPTPFDRFTPREAYTVGARVFAGVAHVLGVDGLCDAMGALYRQRVGGLLSTDELEAHLVAAANDGGADITRAFARWVHGRELRAPADDGDDRNDRGGDPDNGR
jgi:hypothetical protein